LDARRAEGGPARGLGLLFEIKYDGYRLLASRDDGRPALKFRGGGDASASFPEITRVMAGLPNDRIIIDGEVVVLDDQGRPSFGRLQKRARLTGGPDIDRASLELPAVLFAFDLLAFGDRDLRPLPLTERKGSCRSSCRRPDRSASPTTSKGQGPTFLRAAQRMGLEGIVCKRASSPIGGAKRRLDQGALRTRR
jgi:bifunctional non-homologous end joining protein LigD